MRFRDKLSEAKYHLNKIKEESKQLLVRKNAKSLHRFRFEISSFFSSARSVTFVIQKDLSHNIGFNEWYLKTKNNLLDKFKGQVELRNVFEKEGNKFPFFVIFYEATNGKHFEITWDYSGDDIEQFISWGTEMRWEFPSELSEEEKNIKCKKYLEDSLKFVMGNVKEAEIREIKLIFEENPRKEVSVEDFIISIEEYYQALAKIVDEANLFRKNSIKGSNIRERSKS